jgi:hypothetical protein
LNCHKLRGIIVKQPLRSLICHIICMKARLAFLAAMSAVVVLNACKEPTSLEAGLPTFTDTLSVFALSGTPPTYPSGLSLVGRQAVRVDGFANFDVAFDIDTAGKAVIYPVKLVVASGALRAVGLVKFPVPFEAVDEAPETGYEADSSFVLVPGETLVVQSAQNIGSAAICQFALSPYVYAKIAVDSINLTSRTVYFRMGLDPNCGFRSFAPGIPTN